MKQKQALGARRKQMEKIYECEDSFAKRVKKLRGYQKIIKTGMNVIDDPFGGIMPNEIFLIGGDTGVGKTQLALNIAISSAKLKNRTFYFALEAQENELEDKMLFALVAKRYKKVYNKTLCIKKYICGHYMNNYDVMAIEKEIKDGLEDFVCYLHTRYPQKSNYTIQQFIKEIDSITKLQEPSLIIIDHLHYFDFDPKLSQAITFKDIMTALRDVTFKHNIPIILVSQLRRKSSSESKCVAPSLHDFYGSSEIEKICTMEVTIALADNSTSQEKSPTLFRPVKSRFRGDIAQYVLNCDYDILAGTYADNYKICKLTKAGTDLETVCLTNMPHWVKNLRILE